MPNKKPPGGKGARGRPRATCQLPPSTTTTPLPLRTTHYDNLRQEMVYVIRPPLSPPPSTKFILGCHGARRRSPPLLRAPRRGRPTSAHGAVAGEATASTSRGQAGARDSHRATRPVAPVTPVTAAMRHAGPPPHGTVFGTVFLCFSMNAKNRLFYCFWTPPHCFSHLGS